MSDTNSEYPAATATHVEEYNMLYPMLEAILNEMKELSKKKQDAALNEMKVKMTNRILSKVKTLLEGYPTLEFLELLDDEKLPSNSDAVLIIAQFKAAMDQYKTKNSYPERYGRVWNIHKKEK